MDCRARMRSLAMTIGVGSRAVGIGKTAPQSPLTPSPYPSSSRLFAFGDPKSGDDYKSFMNQWVRYCPKSSQFSYISMGYGINFERKAIERHYSTLLGLRIDKKPKIR